MGIIFIDFSKNLNETKSNKNSYFCYTLQEQFATLQNHLSVDKQRSNSLKDLIEYCFPTGFQKKYYLACPNFKRSKTTSDNGVQFLHNVVLRPEITPTMRYYLPDNTNLILIGDIQETDKNRQFIVKGIEYIDENVSSTYDLPIGDGNYCVHVFEWGMSNFGKSFPKWSIDRPDYGQSVFTPDFISKLILTSYPMNAENRKEVVKAYEQWSEYLSFRQRYLQNQSSRHIKIDRVELIAAYAINKQTYNQKASQYEEDLLVKHDDFRKGEQILLKSKVDDSELLYLIVVEKNFNRKNFLRDQIEDKRGHRINPEEKLIKSFSKDNLALSKVPPIGDKYDDILKQSLEIDERYKLIHQDIEPDCTYLEQQYTAMIQQAQKEISERYQALIRKEVSVIISDESIRLNHQKVDQLTQFDNHFFAELESMVEANSDKEIKNKIDSLIRQKSVELSNATKARMVKLDKKHQDYEETVNRMQMESKEKLDAFVKSIDIKKYYIDKHNEEKALLSNQLNKHSQQTLTALELKATQETTHKYIEEQSREKDRIKFELEEQKKKDIASKIEDETIRRFSIFFKVETDDIEKIAKKPFDTYQYLIYNNRAEKAKIDRQQRALDNFYEGNVKNPYLSSYLFAPNELKRNYYDFSNWNWYLESLNDKQKEAVHKAISSKGVFLLQGPPGTGKTQVIAEIIGHLIQDRKKVLVASETHKAIDNVFERLPLLADIRPLRLITDRAGKESEYGPENLVDNFYRNISKNMQNVIHNYERFGEYRDNFRETVQKQKALNDRIVRSRYRLEQTDKEIRKLTQEADLLKEEKRKERDIFEGCLVDKDKLVRTRRHLERGNLKLDADIDVKTVSDFIQECSETLKSNPNLLQNDKMELMRNLLIIEVKTVNEEVNVIASLRNELAIEQEAIQIKRELDKLRDDDGEWLLGTEEQRRRLQGRLKEIRETKNSNLDISDLKIIKMIPSYLLDNILKIKSVIFEAQSDLIDIRNTYYNRLDRMIEEIERSMSDRNRIMDNIESKMMKIGEAIRTLQEDDEYKEIQNDEAKLRREIAKFIETFGIAIEYKTFTEAIEKIQDAYQDLENNFLKKEAENRKTIPIFKKISDYLTREEVILADRKHYTKSLFEKANLFGITTTSRDRFDESQMVDLEKYDLGTIDIKRQGIDVVIIDEVSKSSFIELLIPILLGKTVILVGDHRQLPPMYEFRNLRNEDFEHIDEDILTKSKNDAYAKMYEECFFKTMFERVPNDYKVMLTKQYRSHEHIMQVYNCFYNHKLELGKPGQNSEKEHHLSIRSNNRQIIDPKKHVYFVNCTKFENRDTDSTSIYNHNEAEVVVQLLKLINESYKAHPNFKPDTRKNRDERMSVGVICTYGDQARIIKQKIKNTKLQLPMFNARFDSRMIIATVDDFQGDERDIIILSMVRNPQYRANSNPGFITAYQRINVALSRARRLLIVVGNRSYLEDKGIIDLPDVFGDTKHDQKNFHVYQEVIGAIAKYGTIVDDVDLLGSGQ